MRVLSRLLEPKHKTEAIEVTRKRAGGLLVHIDRPDYHEYRVASGANLQRVLQRLNADVDFLMITSFRRYDTIDGEDVPRSKSKNQNIFSKIPAQIRADLGTKRIGAYWLIGHWATRDSSDGLVHDSLEYSWLLVKDDPSVTEEQWLEEGKKLSRQYDQDAFIVRIGGNTTLRGSDGSAYKDLTTDGAIEEAWKQLAKLRESNQPYGYTELRKNRERGRLQPLVIQDKTSAYAVVGSGQEYPVEFFVAEPHCNSAKMAFHARGITYRLSGH